jgi:hypothetical protein
MYEGGDPEGKLDVFYLSKGSESIVTAAFLADRIHGLGKPSICCALGPEERFGIRLWEHTGRAHEVPCRERKARIAVVLLCCDVLQSQSATRAVNRRAKNNKIK